MEAGNGHPIRYDHCGYNSSCCAILRLLLRNMLLDDHTATAEPETHAAP